MGHALSKASVTLPQPPGLVSGPCKFPVKGAEVEGLLSQQEGGREAAKECNGGVSLEI